MFRRKKDDDDKDLPELADELGIPMKPGARSPAQMLAPRPTPPSPPAMAGSVVRPPSDGPRPVDGPRPSELVRRPGDLSLAGAGAPTALTPTPPAKPRDSEARRLIVGREISLSGEITSCDRLVVEGSVEANLANCRDIDIAESGLFKGSAAIDDAEIRGRFEGNLTVRRRLLVRASGRVTGTIRYGQIEIECGGQISGDVQSQPMADEPGAPAATLRPPVMAVPGA